MLLTGPRGLRSHRASIRSRSVPCRPSAFSGEAPDGRHDQLTPARGSMTGHRGDDQLPSCKGSRHRAPLARMPSEPLQPFKGESAGAVLAHDSGAVCIHNEGWTLRNNNREVIQDVVRRPQVGTRKCSPGDVRRTATVRLKYGHIPFALCLAGRRQPGLTPRRPIACALPTATAHRSNIRAIGLPGGAPRTPFRR